MWDAACKFLLIGSLQLPDSDDMRVTLGIGYGGQPLEMNGNGGKLVL